MATPPRLFENGVYYHVYNRGHRKQQIFLQNRDYERTLDKIIEYKKKFLLNIVAFCLMPNHFHFLLQENSPGSISSFISNLCNSHSRFYNTKYETVGSLFQGRFKAKRVDKDEYLIHLSRYIHLNPTSLFNFNNQKMMIDYILSYKWSSLPIYLSGKPSEIVNPSPILGYFSKENPIADYQKFVIAQMQTIVDPAVGNLLFDEE